MQTDPGGLESEKWEALKRAVGKGKPCDRPSSDYRVGAPASVRAEVLAVRPDAQVRRARDGRYDCFLCGAQLHPQAVGHATPAQAWRCLARHITLRGLPDFVDATPRKP